MLRWDALFADLEGELEAAEAVDFDAEVRDRSRHEVAQLPLAARLRGAEGEELTLTVRGFGTLCATLRRAGPDWVLLADRPAGEIVVPLAAVLSVSGLSPRSVLFRPGEPAARLGLGYALRELARRRVPVRLTLVDGSATAGTLDRVGADFVELAEHVSGDHPRTAPSRLVPWSALAAVRGD